MFGISATTAIAAVGAGTGLYNAVKGGSSQSGSATSSQQQTLDPRMQSILYGSGKQLKPGVAATYAPSTTTNDSYRWAGDNEVFTPGTSVQGAQNNPESDYTNDTGLLGQITALQNQPRAAGMAAFGGAADQYLGGNGYQSLNDMHAAANNLMNGGIQAPTMQAAQAAGSPNMQAAQINAPSQNNTDLSGAYNQMINGNAGANPYLTSALQSGVDQTNAAYQQNQTSLTNNLTRNVLPGIGRSAMMAGGYGGSRQGIAEGNALSDYTGQLSNANLQLGLANSANTTGAQATAFNQGQDRSLNAMNNLSGQQYGVATNNAQFQQQANSQNASQAQQTAMQNAAFQQQANQSNLQAGLSTNQLNSANQATGLSANSGLLNNAYTYGGNNDAYNLNKTGAISGMLSPYAGYGGSSTSSQPLYSNTAGNIMGAATAGLGLYNAYQKANPAAPSDMNNQVIDPYNYSSNYG